MKGIPVLDLQRFESADPAVVAGAARELDDVCRERRALRSGGGAAPGGP